MLIARKTITQIKFCCKTFVVYESGSSDLKEIKNYFLNLQRMNKATQRGVRDILCSVLTSFQFNFNWACFSSGLT